MLLCPSFRCPLDDLYHRHGDFRLYTYDIYLEPINEYTEYLLTEIWIRPTITYGLVACFVSEAEENTTTKE